ncbi:MAG: hypothetical protein J5632_01090 [Bacteroidales bacterium]|nr:hypothetical protein [Bacteroidales bacterium]
MTQKRYIRTILPLRLEWEPCYCLPEPSLYGEQAVPQAGDRILVPFNGKNIVAVVSEPEATPDIDGSRIKELPCYQTVLRPVSAQEIALWRFIADYYCCTVGEVYKAAYPSQKLESEKIHERSEKKASALRERSIEIWKAREARLQARLEAKEDALRRSRKESVAQRLREQRDKIAAELEGVQEQLARFSEGLFAAGEEFGAGLPAIPEGSPLLSLLKGGKPVLLKSPDRTAAYEEAVADCLGRGHSALLLVPEVALATALKEELERRFGHLLAVHHSQCTAAQRRKIADALREGRPRLVLGTRSSIFLPFRDLGLIIVDSEQSPFYKQSDTAPRYNGRDCALKLAAIHGCPVMLGASSPSLEALHNCETGKFALSEVTSPFRGRYSVIDMTAEKLKNGVRGYFSIKLLEEARGKKRIALIRGYEKADELAEQMQGLLPEDTEVFTIPRAQKSWLGGFDLVAMLSADALLGGEDFRADEHAFQFLDSLRCNCPDVVIQTRNAAHRVFSMKDCGALLDERSRFHLPPYTRLVALSTPAGTSVLTLERGLGLKERAAKINAAVKELTGGRGRVIIDVDPI